MNSLIELLAKNYFRGGGVIIFPCCRFEKTVDRVFLVVWDWKVRLERRPILFVKGWFCNMVAWGNKSAYGTPTILVTLNFQTLAPCYLFLMFFLNCLLVNIGSQHVQLVFRCLCCQLLSTHVQLRRSLDRRLRGDRKGALVWDFTEGLDRRSHW